MVDEQMNNSVSNEPIALPPTQIILSPRFRMEEGTRRIPWRVACFFLGIIIPVILVLVAIWLAGLILDFSFPNGLDQHSPLAFQLVMLFGAAFLFILGVWFVFWNVAFSDQRDKSKSYGLRYNAESVWLDCDGNLVEIPWDLIEDIELTGFTNNSQWLSVKCIVSEDCVREQGLLEGRYPTKGESDSSCWVGTLPLWACDDSDLLEERLRSIWKHETARCFERA